MYYREDCMSLVVVLTLFFFALGLLGAVIEWREDRKARRQEQQFKALNRREDLHRRHDNYLAKMQEVLGSVEK